MAEHVFGIDLGTTYSCIAYLNDMNVPEILINAEGATTTPSVVNFRSPQEVGVGQFAKDNAVIDPEHTVQFVKTLMGKSDFAINYNGQDRTPEEVSSYIIRKLALDAEHQLGEKVKNVVITCPAYFGTAERIATENAGRIAGLNVLDVFNEPTAAAIYYGCTNSAREKTILVYDLGGGTFDVTVMRVSAQVVEVICSEGDHDLGGKNWDAAVMNKLAADFCEATDFDGDFDEYAQQDLRIKAEKAKQQLSALPEVYVMVEAAGGRRSRLTLTRSTFDEITRTLLEETLNLTDKAIEIAKQKGYYIDEIILVGGSTRMPQVPEAIKTRYNIEPKVFEPDMAVAKGAAIHARNCLAGAVDNKTVEQKTVGPDIIYATTKSYAIQVLVGPSGKEELKCNNLIIKNQRMEQSFVSATKTYGTASANMQRVQLVVYESDSMDEYYDIDERYVLGKAILQLPGNLPKGAPIEVTFTLRDDGVLEVTGRDKTNNSEVHARMEVSGVMTEEQVEKTRDETMNIVVM